MRSQGVPNFRNTWDRLLSFALRKGVPYQDAEDLVSTTLQIAIDQFAEERGDFLPFCITILGNRIKNFWRDRKQTDPIEEANFPDPGHLEDFEKEEERARMKEMIDRIQEHLTDDEKAFMNALGAAFEDLESRAVSEAARTLGLEPEKGWDVFRRIQRKAKSVFPGLETCKMPVVKYRLAPAAGPRMGVEGTIHLRRTFEPRRPTATPPQPQSSLSVIALARFTLREQSYARAIVSLSAEQKNRLSAIFS